MNIPIGIKMIIGYIVVILIPICIYSVYFYVNTTNDIVKMHMAGNQQLMEQSYSNFKGKISQIESIYQLFQYNNALADFLSGYYTTEGEEVYAYLKYITPLFEYGHASNKPVKDITIYKYRKSLIDVVYYLIDIDKYKGDLKQIKSISPKQGLWFFDMDGKENLLRYYRKFYSKDFFTEVGFFQISVKASDLLGIFNLYDKAGVLLFKYDSDWFIVKNNRTIKIDEKNTTDSSVKYFFSSGLSKKNVANMEDSRLLVNTLLIKELNIQAVLLTPKSNVTGGSREYIMFAYLGILLIILSLIYYAIINSFTGRVVKLARHIRGTDHENLKGYPGETYRDEVGDLTKSYNGMIDRIGALMNSVNIAELKKKEADFYALQAQIKPHFIYNSLETIRMMAEVNGDISVADITYSLGRFIRYNLSKKKNETLLKDEIENVRNYLQIYKVSMGERLQFNIEINTGIEAVKCPGFILQPLVENSIHHGLSSVRGICIIEIEVYEDDEFIIIVISDNGIGIQEDRLKTIAGVLEGVMDPMELKPKGNGIGIVNVNERIKAYFGGRSGLCIYNGSISGTTCKVRFDKNGRRLLNAVDDSR
jgi:Predicted signal transduction protein with a C-terminal ATPase domain